MDFTNASRQRGLALLTITGVVLSSSLHAATTVRPMLANSGSSTLAVQKQHQIMTEFGNLPLAFERNQGQAAKSIDFLSRGDGYTLSLTAREAVFALSPHGKHAIGLTETDLREKRSTLRMTLAGANPAAASSTENILSGKANYFLGSNPRAWTKNVSTFQKVRYSGVYPGVDVVYYGNHRQLEYDFVVKPHADPSRIRLAFPGAAGVRIDAKGELALSLKSGEIHWHRPIVYQQIAGSRKNIDGRYILTPDHHVSFEVARYDSTKPLVIDPALAYESYLSTAGDQKILGIAIDPLNNIYVGGWTSGTLFATPGAAQTRLAGNDDVFITKLTPLGDKVLYSTYIGGSGLDRATGLVVDSQGNAIITGVTNSTDFPTSGDAPQPNPGGGFDAFVSRISADGSALLYSTYIGGPKLDIARGIAIDPRDMVYIVGETQSAHLLSPGVLPTRNLQGPQDGFVVKIDTRRGVNSILYAMYLGGGDVDGATAVAVGPSNTFGQYSAYVTGSTASLDYPVTSPSGQKPFQSNNASVAHGLDAFVTKVNPDGSGLEYSTFLGGSGDDIGTAITVDPAGNAYVAGVTSSFKDSAAQGAFPTTIGSFQPNNSAQTNIDLLDPTITPPGQYEPRDAFVAVLNQPATSLIYSTYIGGSGIDQANGIALNVFNAIFVTGYTTSADFPVSVTADQGYWAVC